MKRKSIINNLQYKISKFKKINSHFIKLYQNWQIFILLFFIVIPSLLIPTNYFGNQINEFVGIYNFHNTYIILPISIILSIYIFANALYIKLIFRGHNNPNSSDYRNALNVRNHVSRILHICGPTFFGITVAVVLFFNFNSLIPTEIHPVSTIVVNLFFPFLIVSLVSAIHIFIHEGSKKFNLELSKAWIYGASSDISDLSKLNSVIMGIENYDDYLQTKIKKRINGLELLYSKLLKDETKNIDSLILEIKNKLNGSDLSLLICLLSYMDYTDQALIQKPRFHKIRENGQLIITLLSAIVPIIAIILQILIPFPNIDF